MYAPRALLLAYSTMPLIVDLYVTLPPQSTVSWQSPQTRGKNIYMLRQGMHPG